VGGQREDGGLGHITDSLVYFLCCSLVDAQEGEEEEKVRVSWTWLYGLRGRRAYQRGRLLDHSGEVGDKESIGLDL